MLPHFTPHDESKPTRRWCHAAVVSVMVALYTTKVVWAQRTDGAIAWAEGTHRPTIARWDSSPVALFATTPDALLRRLPPTTNDLAPSATQKQATLGHPLFGTKEPNRPRYPSPARHAAASARQETQYEGSERGSGGDKNRTDEAAIESDQTQVSDEKKKDEPTPHRLRHPLPTMSPEAQQVPYYRGAFKSDPNYDGLPFHVTNETAPFIDKHPVPTQRPWVEWGRGFYLPGEIPPSFNWLGDTNLMVPHFLVYGDLRFGMAYNKQQGIDKFVGATRLNLDLDLKLTATERIHAFIGPLDRGTNITRFEVSEGDVEFFDELDGTSIRSTSRGISDHSGAESPDNIAPSTSRSPSDTSHFSSKTASGWKMPS